MDQQTKVADLKSEIQRFCEDRDWDKFHSAKDLAIGLITEASELLELFRFKSDSEVDALLLNPEKKTSVRHELADTLFFVLRFAQLYEIDLSSALREKMELNGKRYPVEQAKGNNRKYTELKQ